LVERQPSKLAVASSRLVSRSIDSILRQPQRACDKTCSTIAHVAQSVERFLGKEEVHRFDSGRGLQLFNGLLYLRKRVHQKDIRIIVN
jgi:hypothetical protein